MATNNLTSFIEDVTGDSHLRVQENLGDGFVRLRAKEAQRRQAQQDITCFEDVVLELLRNARDAGAHAIFVASWKEQGARYLTVLDDGNGIPEYLHETIFEPFVTSKLDTFHEDRWGVHGRGMALYSIKENVDDARVQFSKRDAGTALTVHALTSHLTERIDQSTLPYIHINDLNEQIMRGPRNIARVVMEFALDSQGVINTFFGSPVEIAATLLHYRQGTIEESQASDPDAIPNYLKYIHDPHIFSERAAEIGLPLSSRSARRILEGQIKPLECFLRRLTFEQQGKKISPAHTPENKEQGSGGSSKLFREQRKLTIAPEDLEVFQRSIEEAFAELAQHYYLEQSDQLKVRAGSEKITISIPFKMQH